MNADGTNEKLITNNQDASPNWSPDGSKIVFVSSRLGPYQHVFTMNADGTNQQQLTPAPTRGPVVYSTKQEMQPRWSPDGKRIVYVQYDFNDCKIWMINPDRTGNTLVVDSPGRELFPTWSPDGSRIAFSSTRDQTGLGILHTIYTANPDGSAQKRISPLTSSNDPLTWGR
jgi:Tol biopolymer transport system component